MTMASKMARQAAHDLMRHARGYAVTIPSDGHFAIQAFDRFEAAVRADQMERDAGVARAPEAVIVAWLRAQSDIGADHGIAACKGTARRAAYGGGSLALKRAADAIENGEHHAIRQKEPQG